MGDSSHKHDKSEKTEDRADKTDGAAIKLENIKVAKEDAKGIFGHLMKKTESAESKPEVAKEIRYERRNQLMSTDEVRDSVAKVILNYEDKHHGKVYNDPSWTLRHGGAGPVGLYIYYQEGQNLGDPIRTGKETELYHKIVDYTRHHDITDPANKISPAMVLEWSLDINAKSNRDVCIQDALLTSHNVMRALARSSGMEYEKLPEADPIKQIAKDQDNSIDPAQRIRERRANSNHTEFHLDKSHTYRGLRETVLEKYDVKSSDIGHDQSLFAQNEKYSVFKPLNMDREASAGSSYHFWVGVLGASSLSSTATTGAVWYEAHNAKEGSELGQQELPWGNAGIATYNKVRTELNWGI